MDLIRHYPINKCHMCGSKSLELITFKGKEINPVILYNKPEIVDRTIFSKFVCKRCGREFQIDWFNIENHLPEPLIPSRLQDFQKNIFGN